jgi:hypothetical protein
VEGAPSRVRGGEGGEKGAQGVKGPGWNLEVDGRGPGGKPSRSHRDPFNTLVRLLQASRAERVAFCL